MRARRALRVIAVALAAWVFASAAARAQVPHPIPPLMRSLHALAAQRDDLRESDPARVDASRDADRDPFGFRGELPGELELKRSPLRPPPLATGDRALLFLRGDRSPYVLAGEPNEIVRIASAADARALAEALPALLAAEGDLAALARVYASWAKSDSALLRALGHEELAAIPPQSPPPVEPPR